jgi:hypothetical protein
MSGFEKSAPSGEPCPPGFTPVNDGSMTAEMFRQWLNIREMTCGPRVFFDAITGRQLTDREILARIFDGSTIPDPAVVPLGDPAIFLVSALFVIFCILRRRSPTVGET